MGTLPAEYSRAIRAVRTAKFFFWSLMAIAIVAQLVIFGLVAWGGALDPLYKTAEAVSQPATSSAAVEKAEQLRATFQWVLAVTEFAAMVFGVLLLSSLGLAVQITLAGRLGGVEALVSAFFWAVLLLVFLVPWQYAFASSPFSGALFDYNDLYGFTREVKASWGATNVPWLKLIAYHGRFLAYPIVAVLIWLLVDLKFRRGCRSMIVTAAGPTA